MRVIAGCLVWATTNQVPGITPLLCSLTVRARRPKCGLSILIEPVAVSHIELSPLHWAVMTCRSHTTIDIGHGSR